MTQVVWDSVPGSLVVCSALIMTSCCYYKMVNHTHGKMCRPSCINLTFFFFFSLWWWMCRCAAGWLRQYWWYQSFCEPHQHYSCPIWDFVKSGKYNHISPGRYWKYKDVSLGEMELDWTVGVILSVLPASLFTTCTGGKSPAFPWRWPGTSLSNTKLVLL